MNKSNRASFLQNIFLVLLFLLTTVQIVFSQNLQKPTTTENEVPNPKSFAAKYLKRKDLKQYNWEQSSTFRKNDTGNILFIIVKHKNPKENELKYLVSHCTNNQISELVQHQILFADSITKLHPLFISSTSYVCKSKAEYELEPNKKESSNFISKGDKANGGRKLAWVVRAVYKNGKNEPLSPRIYFRIQGALLDVPASCAGHFAAISNWLSGWNDYYSPNAPLQ